MAKKPKSKRSAIRTGIGVGIGTTIGTLAAVFILSLFLSDPRDDQARLTTAAECWP